MNGNSAGILPARLQQTILVIDDDPAMRTILGFTLKAFDYVALVAGDGEEALQIAGYHPEVRLIILDVVMAGLSGKKLADQLQIKLPKAVILFCSGHPPESFIGELWQTITSGRVRVWLAGTTEAMIGPRRFF